MDIIINIVVFILAFVISYFVTYWIFDKMKSSEKKDITIKNEIKTHLLTLSLKDTSELKVKVVHIDNNLMVLCDDECQFLLLELNIWCIGNDFDYSDLNAALYVVNNGYADQWITQNKVVE